MDQGAIFNYYLLIFLTALDLLNKCKYPEGIFTFSKIFAKPDDFINNKFYYWYVLKFLLWKFGYTDTH